MAGREDLEEVGGRIEALVADLGRLGDPRARAAGEDLVRALMTFYGAGLERILELVSTAPSGPDLVRDLAADDLVTALLVLHDLHPVSMEARVRTALEDAATSLGLEAVEVTAIDGEIVRAGYTAGGCPSTQQAVTARLEEAVLAAAPEIAAVEISVSAPPPALLQIQPLRPRSPAAAGQAATVRGTAGAAGP